MKYKPYPAYRDSGVEWAQRTPGHWTVSPLMAIANERDRPNKGMQEKNLLSLSYGEIVTKDINDNDGLLPESFETYQIIEADDIVWRLTDLQNDKRSLRTALATQRGIITSAYLATRINAANARFVAYQLRSYDTTKVFYSMGGGLRQSMKYSDVKRLPMILPPAAEQTAIATFLDRETVKLDTLIAKQEKLIELLVEKRHAVISHAVTKGLNAAAPMKVSGVEWLGEIPRHWGLRRGRFLFKQLDLPVQEDDEVVTVFRDGQVTLRTNRRIDGFTEALLEVGYQHVRSGDLVIHGMDAFAGAIGVSDSNGKCTPEYSVLESFERDMEHEYFAHVLRVMAKRNFIYVICPSVRERAPRFRYQSFKDVLLPIPPVIEQQSILRLIEEETSAIDSLIEKSRRSIELMREHRTALISAAVTGEIDVRAQHKPLQNE